MSEPEPLGPCLCIVMPAYNEAGCIEYVARQWLRLLEKPEYQPARLIAIDDGSSDDTGARLDALTASEPRLEVVHKANGGHGSAVIAGYHRAAAIGARWVFQVDSDDQLHPDDFAALWDRRRESRLVLGNRVSRSDPAHRLLISRGLQLALRLLFGCSLPDANIPYRLFDGRYLAALLPLLPEPCLTPNLLISALAACAGEPLLHIPVRHRERATGRVSLVRGSLLRLCVQSLGEVIAVRQSLRPKLESLELAVRSEAP